MLALFLVLTIVLVSYIQVGHFKNVADTKKSDLEKAIEKNWQLIEQNNYANEDILKQKEYYERQKEGYKNKIQEYEDELKLYEKKASELEQKIDDLDKSKQDIYNILSEKVGTTITASYSSNDNNIMPLNYLVLNQNPAILTKSNSAEIEINTTSDILDKTYTVLETKMQKEVSEYDMLLKEVERYKPYLDALPTTWPVYGRITSTFGGRSNPFGGTSSEYHSGLDIKASTGTPILSTGKGTVSFAGWQNGYGNVVILDHGYGIQTLYAHNTSLAVSVGESVNRGQIICYAGSTGRSTGPHCHYEVIIDGVKQNPQNYLE
jgi:murein DD-endopeptidase MepM/ murein hydrolase activator NlpD